jgi:hypothetical protein
MIQPKSNCWPTPEQDLLLRACLLSDNEAFDAWQRWNDLIDIDSIDHGSHRLLPLLYRNLERFNIESLELVRIKGVYKRTWFQNHLLFKHAQTAIVSLLDLGIETMILKGVAMSVHYYRDVGIRPMDDLDILVRESESQTAVLTMRKLGWCPEEELIQDYHPLYHAISLVNQFLNKVDLHWYLLPQDIGSENESGYWDRAFDSELNGVSVKILSPADQLLHTCVHGMRWSEVPPIRWIADAFEIIKKEGDNLDWDHLIAHSRSVRVSSVMYDALTYLRDQFDTNIPDPVLQDLEQIPKSWLEMWGYNISVKNLTIFSHFVNNRVVWYWLYLRGHYPFPGFFRYLKELWSVRSLWLIPFEGLVRGVRKFRIDVLKQSPESVPASTMFRMR